MIGCDGAGGEVREQIGARYVGRSDPRPNFNVVFRAPSLDTPLGPAVQYWVIGQHARPACIGRLDHGGHWWAILPGVDAEYGAKPTPSDLIPDLIGTAADVDLATDPWTARMIVADRFSDERVFLVGESAHLNPPWGGHGFNTCVGDAVNIAWKIAAVEQGLGVPGTAGVVRTGAARCSRTTVAGAEQNMRSLVHELPPDGAASNWRQPTEFHTLGLVLGYSVRRVARNPARPRTNRAVDAITTPHRPSRARGCRTPGCPTARRCTTTSVDRSRSSAPSAHSPTTSPTS